MWDAWYNGSAHAAQIINGTNNLGWLGPTPGIAGDNKEIWQTETDGEDQTWTKDGAMGFGLKIQNALVLRQRQRLHLLESHRLQLQR